MRPGADVTEDGPLENGLGRLLRRVVEGVPERRAARKSLALMFPSIEIRTSMGRSGKETVALFDIMMMVD